MKVAGQTGIWLRRIDLRDRQVCGTSGLAWLSSKHIQLFSQNWFVPKDTTFLCLLRFILFSPLLFYLSFLFYFPFFLLFSLSLLLYYFRFSFLPSIFIFLLSSFHSFLLSLPSFIPLPLFLRFFKYFPSHIYLLLISLSCHCFPWNMCVSCERNSDYHWCNWLAFFIYTRHGSSVWCSALCVYEIGSVADHL